MAFHPPDSVFLSLTILIVLFGGTISFLFGYFLPSKITEETETETEPDETKRHENETEPREQEPEPGEQELEPDEPDEPEENEPEPDETEPSEYEPEPDETEPPENETEPGKNEPKPSVGEVALRKQDVTDLNYNWLASVNMYRYEDMPSSLEFFCAGTILTRDKMLTGEGCCREHFTKDDLKDAVVRSDSIYFWKGGKEHSVLNIIQNTKLRDPYKQVYIFKVTPHFATYIMKPKIVAAPSVRRLSKNEGKFILVGWGGEQDQTEQILKKKPFYIHKWYTEGLVSCKDNPCHLASLKDEVCCNQAIITDKPVIMQGPVSGRVLVNVQTEPPELLALELIHIFKGTDTAEKDLLYFVDIGDPNFISWLQDVIPDAIIKVKENINNEKTQKLIYSKCQTSRYFNDMEYFSQYNPLAKYIPIQIDEYYVN